MSGRRAGPAVELVDDRLEVGGVVRDPAKRIRRRKNRVLVTVEEIEHGPPTRRVSERTVNKDNRRFGHETSFTAEGDGGLCRTSGGLRFGGAVTAWTSRGHSAD